jgi:hypothetical protein
MFLSQNYKIISSENINLPIPQSSLQKVPSGRQYGRCEISTFADNFILPESVDSVPAKN